MSLSKVAAKFANKLNNLTKVSQELVLRDGRIHVKNEAEKLKAQKRLKDLGLHYPVVVDAPAQAPASQVGKPRSYQELTGRAPGSEYVEPAPKAPSPPQPKPAPAPKAPETPPRGYWVRTKGNEHDPYAKTYPIDYHKWMAASPSQKAKYVIVGTW